MRGGLVRVARHLRGTDAHHAFQSVLPGEDRLPGTINTTKYPKTVLQFTPLLKSHPFFYADTLRHVGQGIFPPSVIFISAPLSSSCFHQWDRIGDSGPSGYDATRLRHHGPGRVPVLLRPQPEPVYAVLLFAIRGWRGHRLHGSHGKRLEMVPEQEGSRQRSRGGGFRLRRLRVQPGTVTHGTPGTKAP